MNEEQNGNVVIHRYDEIEKEEQKLHANYFKEHLDENEQMKEFYIKNFSLLWD